MSFQPRRTPTPAVCAAALVWRATSLSCRPGTKPRAGSSCSGRRAAFSPSLKPTARSAAPAAAAHSGCSPLRERAALLGPRLASSAIVRHFGLSGLVRRDERRFPTRLVLCARFSRLLLLLPVP